MTRTAFRVHEKFLLDDRRQLAHTTEVGCNRRRRPVKKSKTATFVAELARNVADVESGAIDWPTFHARQREAWDRISASPTVERLVLAALLAEERTS